MNDLQYDVLFEGSNLTLANAVLGLSSVTLVRGGDTRLLFDTGQQGNRRTVEAELQKLGLVPGDITDIVLSHVHYDHANNLDLFPNATIHMSDEEWLYLADPHPDDWAVPAMLREQIISREHKTFAGEVEFVPGAYILETPGHTVGHVSLRLEMPDSETVVLAGDALCYPKEIAQGYAEVAFGGAEEARKSLERIQEIATRIVPGHFCEITKSPETGRFFWPETQPFEIRIR